MPLLALNDSGELVPNLYKFDRWTATSSRLDFQFSIDKFIHYIKLQRISHELKNSDRIGYDFLKIFTDMFGANKPMDIVSDTISSNSSENNVSISQYENIFYFNGFFRILKISFNKRDKARLQDAVKFYIKDDYQKPLNIYSSYDTYENVYNVGTNCYSLYLVSGSYDMLVSFILWRYYNNLIKTHLMSLISDLKYNTIIKNNTVPDLYFYTESLEKFPIIQRISTSSIIVYKSTMNRFFEHLALV